MIRIRLVLSVLAAAAALAIAGCGGGGDSSSELAGLAPPGSVVFVEADVRPTGELKSNADSLAKKIAGVDSLGELIVEKLEEKAGGEGETLDFDKEVKPWLGERAAISFSRLDSEGNPAGYGIVLPATDSEAAQATIDRQAQAKANEGSAEKGSYQGVEYWTDTGDETTIGMIGDTVVGAEDTKSFKAAVDASEGESLADESQFQDTISAASDGSLADVYLDLGGLIDGSEGEFDPRVFEVLQSGNVAFGEAPAVASIIPGTNRVQIDLSSDLGGRELPSGDAAALIGTLPGDSVAAVGFSEFSRQLKEALDELDKEGIPNQLPPNQLKSSLGSVGIDADKIADSLEDGAIFARGNSEGSLSGAMVLTTDSKEAGQAIEDLSTLLTNTATAGVTAVSNDGAKGFLIRIEELGDKPIAMLTEGDRVAIGYGLAPALIGLRSEDGETLSEVPSYKAAVSALGKTPIGGFADGPSALDLAEALVPRSEEGFWEAAPYLKKIEFIAMGSGGDDDVATAKLIVGLKK